MFSNNGMGIPDLQQPYIYIDILECEFADIYYIYYIFLFETELEDISFKILNKYVANEKL